jgi:3-oxoacyl-[acyl-carrier protein] reductase
MTARVVLVTGSSRGIGRAIAEHFAELGHRVAVNYATSKEAAEEVVSGIRDGGGEAVAFGAEVGRESEVAGLFEAVSDSLGPVEILVNNAGITRDGLVMRMSSEDWADVMRVNLDSVFFCTKAALRPMLKARWGRIISITSVAGLAGNPGQGNYAASKAGIIGFTKSIAKEVGSRGITVNAVAPGFIDSDMTSGIGDSVRETVLQQVSVGRFGTAPEIAAAVGYLASEEAAYVNGHVLVVDGGLAL